MAEPKLAQVSRWWQCARRPVAGPVRRAVQRTRGGRHVGVAVLFAVLVAVVSQCGGTSSPVQPSPPPTPPPTPTPVPTEPILVGAGDIALCSSDAHLATAALLDDIGGYVFTLGDNIYGGATLQSYRACYGPSWGRHFGRTRPSPGNHDYEPSGPGAYDQYFQASGPEGLDYYSYDFVGWHIISLNSNISMASGSAQYEWLANDLASNVSRCTVAYWHTPLFSSGPNGPHKSVRDAWVLMYNAGVDVVLNGDDHLYERFGPQNPDGKADAARGIRQFTVGTGGGDLYAFRVIQPNSEAQASVYGVLKLTLRASEYEWEFVSVASSYHDAGRGTCH